MNPPQDLLVVGREGRAATLTFGRPPLNILDLDLLAQLDAALASLACDRELQVVFVRGAGEKAFSAGVSVQDHTPDKIDRMLLSFHGALARLRDLEALTVALVDGHCLGGGMELALVADLVLATERSRFGQPEIALGCYPPVAAALYPRRIGSGRTLELLLTGRTFDCAEAEHLGFVHERLADRPALDGRAAELGTAIQRQSAAVTRLTKRAVRAGETRAYGPALAEAEHLYLRELTATADMAEGIQAFIEKRPPTWRHR
ncbi:MAG: enoyl-CoA hydratase/isomerase family protein [Thermoanaerobaculia bacterium]